MIYTKRLQVEIPDEIQKDIKAEAAKQGKTLKQLFTEIVEGYLATRNEVSKG